MEKKDNLIIIDNSPLKKDSSELKAFNILKTNLRNTSSILYFKPVIFFQGRSFNLDAIWLHPYIGIVIIEIKGWNKEFIETLILKNNKVNYFFSNKTLKYYKNPISQAEQYKEIIISLIKKEKNKSFIDYPVNYIIFFSNLKKEDYFSLKNTLIKEKIPVCKCIFQNSKKQEILEKIGEQPLNIFIPKYSNNKFNFIRKILFPELTIDSWFSQNISQDDIILLDIYQEKILKNHKKGLKIIRGIPGSGKTVVLIGKALYEKLYYPYKKIILISYTNILVNEIKNSLKSIIKRRNLNLNINDFKIETIDSLVAYLYKKYIILKKEKKEEENNLHNRLNKLIDYLKNNSINIEDKYDVILCDEVQDFLKEHFKIIESIKKEKDSILIFSVDETQRIYPNRDWKWKELGYEARGNIVSILKRNYRSTFEILDFGIKFLQKDKVLSKRLKEIYIELNNIESLKKNKNSIEIYIGNEYNIVKNKIKFFLQKGIKPEEIFILNPYTENLKKFYFLLTKESNILKEKEIYIVSSWEQKKNKYLPKNKLVITTYHNSKGLERKIVIITGVSSFPYIQSKRIEEVRRDRRALYTAITRAKEKVIITVYREENFGKDIVELKNFKNFNL